MRPFEFFTSMISTEFAFYAATFSEKWWIRFIAYAVMVGMSYFAGAMGGAIK